MVNTVKTFVSEELLMSTHNRCVGGETSKKNKKTKFLAEK